MSPEEGVPQSTSMGLSGMGMYIAIGIILLIAAPAVGRWMTSIVNMLNSVFTTLFHNIFPGMDWM